MVHTKFPHEDKKFFKQAVESSYASSLFSPHLIEKDYFCSLILRELYSAMDVEIIFKGGTLLNKVHLGFYRLSEDLAATSQNGDPKGKACYLRKFLT